MQFVKKKLLNGQEEEGTFCRTNISERHHEELLKVLSKADLTYGDIKGLLKEYKKEVLNSSEGK